MNNLHVSYLKGYITKLAQVLGTTMSTGAGGQMQGQQPMNPIAGDPVEEIVAQGKRAKPQNSDMVESLITGQAGKMQPKTPGTADVNSPVGPGY